MPDVRTLVGYRGSVLEASRDAEHVAGGADVGAAPGMIGVPGQFQSGVGQQLVELRPAGQRRGQRVAAADALADLFGGQEPHADQTAVGELDGPAGVHVPRVDLLLAGDGGRLRGGGGQTDEAGVAQRLGFGRQRHFAEHLHDTGRGNERVFLGDLVGPLSEGRGVIGQGHVGGDQGVGADAAQDVLGLVPQILGFDGRAGDDTAPGDCGGVRPRCCPGRPTGTRTIPRRT